MKKNKVLFIIHDVYQGDNQTPLGPAYLAAVLKECGAYVEAYCMDVFHYTNKDLEKHLQKNDYDLIGVGFLAARFNETILGLCKVINKNKKNAWLVLGGHGPSPIPEYMLRKTKADIVMIGEGENTIIPLLECKVKKGDLSKVKGIAYLKKGKFKKTALHSIIENLNSLPFPLWDIFPMDKYTTNIKVFNQKPNEKCFEIMTSRGCVNRCNFCYRMEKGLRLRSISNIINELKILKERYGVTCYFFQDELFVVNKKRLLEFEKGLKEATLKIKFSCNARVDIIDEELVKILKRIGCQFLNIGFESSSNKVLKLMNKNTTNEKNLYALKVIKRVGGIGCGLNFIWNNLGDTKKTLFDNVKLIKKYNTYYHCRTIRPVTPYPGSDLYYKAIKMGKLKGPEDFFNKFKNSDLITVNFMKISNKKVYEYLFKANKDLILDHYKHTKEGMKKAEHLIQQFKNLYSDKTIKFRGARHYLKNGKN